MMRDEDERKRGTSVNNTIDKQIIIFLVDWIHQSSQYNMRFSYRVDLSIHIQTDVS